MMKLVDKQHKNVLSYYLLVKQKLHGLRSTKLLLMHYKLEILKQLDEQSGMQKHTDQMVSLMQNLY